MGQEVRQEELSATASLKRQRSELPIAQEETGRTLPDLTNAEIHRILEEEVAAGRPSGPEEGVEQAWTEEAHHRFEEIRRDDVETQASDDVFREARARLR
ncbi:MAG TPA: hypothetical protein VGG20_13035, partial [Thermoanaerobaculia bacterium]|jgi:hypothetical protein